MLVLTRLKNAGTMLKNTGMMLQNACTMLKNAGTMLKNASTMLKNVSNNNNNYLFYIAPQQQLYELLALYRSTNAIEHTSICYLN